MNPIKFTGYIFLTIGLLILINTFIPLIRNEFNYYTGGRNNSDYEVRIDHSDESSEPDKLPVVYPVDKHFSIIIPKLGANSKVIENVDPFNPAEYQNKLSQGVAHSNTSALPNQKGNTFLFAHSSDNFYNANRYNSVFYLVNKLEEEDVFYIVYDGETQKYKIDSKNIVDPSEVQYLYPYSQEKTVTLMTCWPPGTTLKRLIVEGTLIEE